MASPIEIFLEAYRAGIFPMAEDAGDDRFAFYKPHQRGILPIEKLHIPARLIKTLRKNPYRVTMDSAFDAVISGCAAQTPKRQKTWINAPIRDIFIQLHREGHAHSIECWDKDGALAGGIYGLHIGSVFCGESMFSRKRDASKIALVHLCAILFHAHFKLLDAQFINDHLLQFGAYEIAQQEYEAIIAVEMEKQIRWPSITESDIAIILKQYLEMKRTIA
jgi:leucyl/phenylalanyl-tRNA---protein transferase